MSQELLENRWSETKEALLEGLQGTRRSTMGVVLENTRKHLTHRHPLNTQVTTYHRQPLNRGNHLTHR